MSRSILSPLWFCMILNENRNSEKIMIDTDFNSFKFIRNRLLKHMKVNVLDWKSQSINQSDSLYLFAIYKRFNVMYESIQQLRLANDIRFAEGMFFLKILEGIY
uniref:Uncharacterized protein n=1 Tax=Spironucleus salmonicida TaxID=348837 RepID=V6M0W6_9EUKA|eukprot:EST46789.1 Hypothetical protein SS50377_13189 [Spironucleus salmonicida]